MKILIPLLGFARAGGARVLSELANAWIEAGHSVDFLVPDTSNDPYFPTSAAILRVGARGDVPTSQEGPSGARETGVRNLYVLWRGLSAIGRRYDVILANHSLTPWPVLLSGVPRQRVFYYIQAYEPEYFTQVGAPIKALFSRLSYSLAFHQIVNADLYVGYRGIRGRDVVPFGIDLGVFHPRTVQPFAERSAVTLGCIGRTEPAKGTPYVLAAFETLAAADAKFRLKVAYGNLPEGWSHPRAEIVVPQNDRELADFYRSVDVVIAAGTVQHGAPHYPVLEAMACGTPVVNTGYLPATPENSWLAEPKNADSIVAQVLAVVADPAPEIRTVKALEAAKAFEWQVVAGKMAAIFRGGQ